MAEVLLDTHAFVWAVSAPDRLGELAREVIVDQSTDLLVSAASAWEMAIKARSGKWPQVEPLLAGLEAVIERLGARPLDIAPADARRAGLLAWEHRDPFDRMLAAQATLHQLPLVTRDAPFGSVAGLGVLW